MQDARLAGRLHKELKMLQDPPPGVCVWPADEHNLLRLEAQIQGPDGTVYSKGIFKLEVEIPDRYPFEPPNVKFTTPVYHPNIDSGGRICHDILNMPPKGQWRPSLNIGAVLASIRVLLEEPNHDDGLMSDISSEYKHNRALFDDKARRSTERYAMQNGIEAVSHDTDQVKASASQATSSKYQALETANHDTFARSGVKEVNRMGASKVALDEPSTSELIVAASTFTPARPRQNCAAKLSLAKGSSPQGVRSSSVGGAREAEPISSLSFSAEKERALEAEVTCGPASQNVPLPSELSSIVRAGKEASHKPEDVTGELVGERLDCKDADIADRNEPAICNMIKDKQLNTEIFISQVNQRTSLADHGKRLTLPKTKLLKLSRPQPSASQFAHECTQTGRTRLGPSHSKGALQLSKDSVILLDSESDDEDFRVQARSQGVKRKHGRT